jgi:hypothetical protein
MTANISKKINEYFTEEENKELLAYQNINI